MRLVPQSIAGHRIIESLGSGGSGDVFRAWRPVHGEVALKLVPPTSEVTLERVQREARAISSRRIPRVFEVGQDASTGLLYIATALIRGETLQKRLERLGGRDWAEVSRMVDDLVEALDDMHRHGLVHRDVSPSNIVVVTDENDALLEAWLIDLGLVRGPDDRPITTTGAVAGTQLYLAPERLGGAEATPRSDIYALATVAYDALAGPPDAGAAPAKQWRDLAQGGGRRRLPEDMPRDARAALARGRHVEPFLRYGSAGAFANAFALRCPPGRLEDAVKSTLLATYQTALVGACVAGFLGTFVGLLHGASWLWSL